MKLGSTGCPGYTSPQRGEVGLHLAMRSIVQSNPGEGPQLSTQTGTPHPDRIYRCDPTSPYGRGEPGTRTDSTKTHRAPTDGGAALSSACSRSSISIRLRKS